MRYISEIIVKTDFVALELLFSRKDDFICLHLTSPGGRSRMKVRHPLMMLIKFNDSDIVWDLLVRINYISNLKINFN